MNDFLTFSESQQVKAGGHAKQADTPARDSIDLSAL